MALHLVKLCVGIQTLDELHTRLAHNWKREGRLYHITRMVPTRQDELLAGGSLYWVIRHRIRARQKLLGVEAYVDEGGVRRCRLMLAPQLIEVETRRRRPFQGWRYLPADDAPPDKPGQEDKMIASLGKPKKKPSEDLPAEMEDILNDMGVV